MKKVLIIGVLFGVLLPLQLAHATRIHKVTICHATGSQSNPYTRNVVDIHATGGHFDNNGTPLAGHEDDILLQGEQDCPAPSVTPTVTVEPTITPTDVIQQPTITLTDTPVVTQEPTVTPTDTVTPTPEVTTVPENKSNVSSNSSEEHHDTRLDQKSIYLPPGGINK